MRILFFGDSICAGSDLPDGSPADAWPALFAAAHPQHTVYNQSRGGRPTDSLDEFRAALAIVPVCDLLVLALGTNDSRDLSPDMPARAAENLRIMISLARAAGTARAILIGPYNISPESLGATYPIRKERSANIDKLNETYRQLAQELQIGFHSLNGVLPLQSLTHDGVHPDKAGNRILAECFAEYWRSR